MGTTPRARATTLSNPVEPDRANPTQATSVPFTHIQSTQQNPTQPNLSLSKLIQPNPIASHPNQVPRSLPCLPDTEAVRRGAESGAGGGGHMLEMCLSPPPVQQNTTEDSKATSQRGEGGEPE